MSVIFKCDNCGETVESYTVVGLRRVPMQVPHPQAQLQTYKRIGEDLDPCDECLRKVKIIVGDKEKK